MKAKKICCLLLTLLLAVQVLPVQIFALEHALYVAPYGNDSNTGTQSAPLKTVQAAKRLAKATGVDTVYFYAGTYTIDSTLEFDSADNGVTYKAVAGQEVIFSGAYQVGGNWDGTADKNGKAYWYKTLTEEEMNEIGDVTVFYNESGRLNNARMPNDGYYFAVSGGRAQSSEMHFAKNLSVYGKTSEIGTLTSEPDISHTRIRIYHYWIEEYSYIESVNSITGEIVMATATTNTTGKNDPYYIENAWNGFDADGEWYMDYENRRLCYFPKAGDSMANTPFYLGYTQELMLIDGAQDISFNGITFAYTGFVGDVKSEQSAYKEHSAVTVQNATRIGFTDCSFRYIGAAALCFGNYGNAVSDCTVTGCQFSHIGAQAIVVAGANSQQGLATRITVTDNLIEYYGEQRKMAAGIMVTFGSHISITHNEVHNGMYTGITVGWTWGYGDCVNGYNDISYNVLYNIGYGPLSDLGGIYTLGIQPESRVCNNVIFDVCTGENATTYGGFGIYLDEGSTGFTVSNNVIYHCGSQAFQQHYGSDNLVKNNIFAYNTEGQVRLPRSEEHNQIRLNNNILVGNNQLMYQSVEEGRFTDDSNLYFDAAAPVGTVYSGSFTDAKNEYNYTVTQMQSMQAFTPEGAETPNYYYHNAVFADPCFIDAQNGNFGFTNETNARSAGFIPSDINMQAAGSTAFGSRYLLNTLSYEKGKYPTSLWNAYVTAKQQAITERTDETRQNLALTYSHLQGYEVLSDYTIDDEAYYFSNQLSSYYSYCETEDSAVTALRYNELTQAKIAELADRYNALNVEHSITIDANGGYVENNWMKYSLQSVLELPTPVRSGYVFTGYLRTEDNALITDLTYYAGAGTYILVAQWEKCHTIMMNNLFDFDSYKITTGVNAQSIHKDNTTDTISFTTTGVINSYINLDPAGAMHLTGGHTYRVYYNLTITDKNGQPYENVYNASRVTVIPYYSTTQTGHNVLDYAAEYQSDAFESIRYGATFTVPQDASIIGLRFGAKDSVTDYYTLSYSDIYVEDISDDTQGEYRTVKNGETVGKMPTPTGSGYFVGWNTKSNGTGTYITENTVMSNSYDDFITLYPVYGTGYTVYYDNEFDFVAAGYQVNSSQTDSGEITAVDNTNRTISYHSLTADSYAPEGTGSYISLEGDNTYRIDFNIRVWDTNGVELTDNPGQYARITVLPYNDSYSLVWADNPTCKDCKPGDTFTVRSDTTNIKLRFGLNNTAIGYTAVYSDITLVNVTGRSAPTVTTQKLGGGATLESVAGISRSGYAFTGWNTKKDGTGTAYSVGSKMPSSDLFLYSQWVEKHSVNFDSEFDFGSVKFPSTDGRSTSDVYTDYTTSSVSFVTTGADAFIGASSRIELIPGHTYKFDYTFYLDGKENTSSTRFTILPYNENDEWQASYYVENLTSGSTYTVHEGAEFISVRLGMSGSTAGHTIRYSGIYIQDVTNELGDADNVSTPLLNGEKTYYFMRSPGEALGELPEVCRDGFRFVGWNTKKDGTGTWYNSTDTMGHEDIWLYSQWELCTAQITFDYNNGVQNPNLFVSQSSQAVSTTSYGVTYTYDPVTGIITLDGTPDGSFTFYYNFPIQPLTEGNYVFSAQYVGGSVDYLNHTYNSCPHFDLCVDGVNFSPRKFFDIRFEKSDLSPLNSICQMITIGASEQANSIKFSYYHSAGNGKSFHQYQFRVKLEKGNTVTEYSAPSRRVTFGDTYGTLPIPAQRQGYTFAGWYTAKQGGKQITADTVSQVDSYQVLYARWLPETYRIYYDGLKLDDTSSNMILSVIKADSSWQVQSNGTYTKSVNGITIVYSMQQDTFEFNGTLSGDLPSYPFVHFLKTEWETFGEELTLTGEYISGSYTDNTNSSCVAPVSYLFADPVYDTVNDVFSKNNSTEGTLTNNQSGEASSVFWYDMKGSFSATSDSKTKRLGLFFATYFEINNPTDEVSFDHYTFRLRLTSNNTLQYKQVSYQTPVGRMPTPESKTGYIFDGWFTQENGGVRIDSTTAYSFMENKVLYAHWSPITYTVNFHRNGGVGNMVSQSFTYDAPLTALSLNQFTYTCHNFLGWSTSSNPVVTYTDGQAVGNLTDINNGEVDLYAVWEANHTFGEYETMTDGTRRHRRICSVDNYVEITSCVLDEGTVMKEATCSTTGIMRYICTICAGSFDEVISTKEHSWDEGTIISVANCVDTGVVKYVCTECLRTSTGTLPTDPNNHKRIIVDEAVTASCAKNGKTEGSHCIACKTVIKARETIPAYGHTEVSLPAVSATCQSTGLTAGVQCSVCGVYLKKQTVTPQINHIESAVCYENQTADICTELATYDMATYCTMCHTEMSRKTVTTNAIGHEMNDWHITKVATVSEDGVMERECVRCSYSEKKLYTFDYDSELTRTVSFETFGLVVFMIDVGNGVKTVSDLKTDIKWYDNQPLTFKVYALNTTGVTPKITANGEKLVPDENGVYTIPAGKKTVTVIGVPVGGEEEAPVTPVTCDHICHNNGTIPSFFWKIILFFNKLFGVNKTCKCGAAHY